MNISYKLGNLTNYEYSIHVLTRVVSHHSYSISVYKLIFRIIYCHFLNLIFILVGHTKIHKFTKKKNKIYLFSEKNFKKNAVDLLATPATQHSIIT